jgi:uncharacterized YccA/Bax inhibitor family protein
MVASGSTNSFRGPEEDRMPSPVLNERTLEKAPATWAPPEPSTAYHGPIDDGPISTWRPAMMTVNGTIGKTAVLFTLLLVSAAAGWMNTDSPEVVERNGALVYNYTIPALAWVGAIVGIGLVFLLMFKPHLAKFIAPAYALAQGFFVGALSKMYETFFDGIVVQAAGATIAVFGVMLFLYRARIIKVTERFRTIVISATIGIMVFYGVCFLVRLFAGADSVSFLASASLISIGFSVLVAGIAAMNLALDFDFIERGSKMGLDKGFEWYGAFALLVTIVWLYMEMLRLIAKLRSR